MSYLRIANLKKSYRVNRKDIQPVLKGINAEFKRGELVAILGESGCGKSTLLNILGGLDNDYTGSVVLDGEFFKDYTDKQLDDYRKSKVGLVFQSYNLISHMTVKQNVEIALTMNNVNSEVRKELVKNALERVGLTEDYNKLPKQLSGGQRQRVAIARALVNDPEIILADEPTGALDKESSEQVMAIFDEIAKSGKLVIIVTHSQKVASNCSRIITIDDGVIKSDVKNKDINTNVPKPRKGKPQNIKLKDIFKIAFSNIMQTKKRSFLVAIGMSIGIAAVILISCLSGGVANYVTNEITSSTNPLMIEVTRSTNISHTTRDKFLDIDGVDYVIAGTYLKENSQFNYDGNIGFIYMLQTAYTGLSDCLITGEYCQDNQMIINDTFAKALYSGDNYQNILIGKTIKVTYSNYTIELTISGIYQDSSDTSSEKCAYINDNTFDSIYDGADKTLVVNTVYVFVKDTSYISAVMDTFEAMGYTASRNDATVETLLNYIDLGSKVLTGFSAISLVVSAIMIFIVTYISIIERTKEIGVLRAIGGRKKDVTLLFMCESMLLGVISGLLAIITTLFISIVANIILANYISTSLITIDVGAYLVGLLISVVLSVLAGLIPSLEGAKLDPVEALRSE